MARQKLERRQSRRVPLASATPLPPPFAVRRLMTASEKRTMLCGVFFRPSQRNRRTGMESGAAGQATSSDHDEVP